MRNRITRRRFMKQVAGAGLALPLIAPRLGFAESPNGKLQHAAVGAGGRGRADLNEIVKSGKVDVVALCDVDENTLNEAGQAFPGARKYRDWREMLAKEEKNIDSVSVGTPDHMHAPVAMSALRLGKHVFCEKPLTHEVYEARQVTEAARKAGVVTQMGIQIHSHVVYRTAVRLIQDGAIGKVKEWHSWCSAHGSAEDLARPEGEDPVPAHLDWDLWIGVAPFRPFKEDIYHPNRWRAWQDFGCGALGDFGCHIFDPVFTALEIGPPLSVRAEEMAMGKEVWPVSQVVHYEFPGTSMTSGKIIEGTWRDGGKQPSPEVAGLPKDFELPKSGSLIIGEEGVLLLPHYDKPRLLPEEKFANYAHPEVDDVNHYAAWVNACLSGGKAPANFDYSGPLAEAVLLGNVAARMSGKALMWDAANLKVTNVPEANDLLRRAYREGWDVAGLSA